MKKQAKTTKTTTKTEKATVTAPVTPEPTNLDTVVPNPKAKKIANAKVAPAKAETVAAIQAHVERVKGIELVEASKRVTPGARVNEWRIVRSQESGRRSQWFLQGGHFATQPNGRNHFVCGSETSFADRAAAQAALATQQNPAAA